MCLIKQTTIWLLSITFSFVYTLPLAMGRMAQNDSHNNNNDRSSSHPSPSRRESFYYQRNIRPPIYPKSEVKQLCGQHLRYAISALCKNRGYFADSYPIDPEIQPNVQETSASAPFETSTVKGENNNYSGDLHEQTQHRHRHHHYFRYPYRTTNAPIIANQETATEGKKLPIIIEGHNIAHQRRLPRQVVSECCDHPCKEEALLKYCGLFGGVQRRDQQQHYSGQQNPLISASSSSLLSSDANETEKNTIPAIMSLTMPHDLNGNVLPPQFNLKQQQNGKNIRLRATKTLRRKSNNNRRLPLPCNYPNKKKSQRSANEEMIILYEIKVNLKVSCRHRCRRCLGLNPKQSSPNSDEVESEELEWQFQQENKTGTQAAKSRSGGNYFSSSAVPYGNHRQNLGSNDWIISNSQTSHGFGDRQRKDESKHFIEGAQDEHYVKPRTNHNQQELLQQQQIHPEQFSSTSNSIDRFGSQIQQQLQSKGSSRNSRNGRGRSNMKFPTTTRTPDVFVFPLGLSDQVLNG